MNWIKLVIMLSAAACSASADDISADSGDTSDEIHIDTTNLPGNICQVRTQRELTRDEFLYVIRQCMSDDRSILKISSLITMDGHSTNER